MRIKPILQNILLIAVSALLLVSCHDKEKKSDESSIEEACRFISEVMYQYYYWLKDLPETDYTKESDPMAYFEKLRSKDDPFSYVSDKAQEDLASMDGDSKDKGWEYSFLYLDNNMYDIVAVVNYVHKNTPAYAAGVRRGDCIIMVGNEKLNRDNYGTLFRSSSAVYKGYRYNKANGGLDPIEFEITDSQNTKNAVSEYAIFDGNIGYLLYTQYTTAFNSDLDRVAEEFKAAGVKNVILDLRYNLGGYNDAMRYLCSILAPKSAVDNEDIIIWFEFNENLSRLNSYKKENNADRFTKSVKTNLDLEKVVFIVGDYTYSSSEATVIGLQPYMDTYKIGRQTGGKNYTMMVFAPEDFVDRRGRAYFDSSINNWLLVPIVAKYRNSADYTFVSEQGIAPDYEMNELDYDDMGELGSPDEPLTAAAIEYIKTGSITPRGNKSATLRGSRELKDNTKRGYMIKRFSLNEQ